MNGARTEMSARKKRELGDPVWLELRSRLRKYPDSSPCREHKLMLLGEPPEPPPPPSREPTASRSLAASLPSDFSSSSSSSSSRGVVDYEEEK